jgi:hypothetical protein
MARWAFDVTRSTISGPTARSRQTRSSSSAAIWMLDLCFSTSAPPVALAPAKVAQTLRVWVRRLRADDVTTRRGRGSEGFGPWEAMPQHQSGTDPPASNRTPQPRQEATLDQIVLARTWSRMMAHLDLMWSRALADAGLRPGTKERRVSMLSSILLAVSADSSRRRGLVRRRPPAV